MIKVILILIFILNAYGTEKYITLDSGKEYVTKEKDLFLKLQKGNLYIKYKNEYKLLMPEELEDSIDIIRFNDIFAFEIARSQVNITYTLYQKKQDKLFPSNIDVTNPIFLNNRIFSYYKTNANWYLDVICYKPKMFICGKGELDYKMNKDVFKVVFDNNILKYYSFDGIEIKKEVLKEKINYKSIQTKKQPLYSQPPKKTKMYLLKGDKIEILEEKDDWVKILYKGKKDIKAWIPKSSIE